MAASSKKNPNGSFQCTLGPMPNMWACPDGSDGHKIGMDCMFKADGGLQCGVKAPFVANVAKHATPPPPWCLKDGPSTGGTCRGWSQR